MRRSKELSPEQKPRDAAGVVQTHLLWNGREPLWATFPVASEWHGERAQEPSALHGNASMSATPPTP